MSGVFVLSAFIMSTPKRCDVDNFTDLHIIHIRLCHDLINSYLFLSFGIRSLSGGACMFPYSYSER